jgi:hypothetical protein
LLGWNFSGSPPNLGVTVGSQCMCEDSLTTLCTLIEVFNVLINKKGVKQ